MSQKVKEQGVIRITLVNRRQCICVRKNTVRNKLGNICQNYKKRVDNECPTGGLEEEGA